METKIYRTAVKLVPLTLLTGCFYSHPRYPRNWPKQASSSEDIQSRMAGTYECLGDVKASSKRGMADLGVLFIGSLPSREGKPGSCDRISIVPMENGLDVTAVSFDKNVAHRFLTFGVDYKSVKKNWILFSKVGGFESGDNVAIAYTSQSLYMTMSQAGDLIFKRQESGTGIVLLIPFGVTKRWWYKFKRLGPPDTP